MHTLNVGYLFDQSVLSMTSTCIDVSMPYSVMPGSMSRKQMVCTCGENGGFAAWQCVNCWHAPDLHPLSQQDQ